MDGLMSGWGIAGLPLAAALFEAILEVEGILVYPR
jgi:hypothetical protein